MIMNHSALCNRVSAQSIMAFIQKLSLTLIGNPKQISYKILCFVGVALRLLHSN